MGRDSNPRCIAAHTLSKRAQSTTLPPILGDSFIKHGQARRRKPRSAFPGIPEIEKQKAGGDGGGGGEHDEEEVDERVHAREQNTGGGTSAGGGRKNKDET